jgi:hypothetical protein
LKNLRSWLNATLFGCDVFYLCVLAIIFVTAGSYLSEALVPGTELVYVRDGNFSITDFLYYYEAGEIARSPQRHHAYDVKVQLDAFNSHFKNYKWDKPFYVAYPPYTFALCIPLTLLPMWNAYAISLGVSFIFATAVLMWLGLTLKTSTAKNLALTIFILLCSWPALFCFRLGQPSYLLTGLIALYALLFYTKRDFAAGLVLAVSSFKIQYAPLLAVPALATWRKHILLGGLVGETILLLLAGGTLGFENVINYPKVLLFAEHTQDIYGFHAVANNNVRGLLACFGFDAVASPVSFGCMIVAMLFGGWLWYRASRNEMTVTHFAWLFSFTVLTTLLFSLHTLMYDLMFVMVPAVLTSYSVSMRSAWNEKDRLQAAWIVALLFFPLFSWLQLPPLLNRDFAISRDAMFTVYLVALWAISLVMSLRVTAAQAASK